MTEAITFLFHDDTVDLIDRLQERFGLKSREAAIAEALKLLAVADKNPLFVFQDEQLMELEISKKEHEDV